MTAFFIGLLVLLIGSLVYLLRPLLRPQTSTTAPAADAGAGRQQAMTLAILRDQQAELAQDRALGNLSEEAYATAHQELQRRVLEELAQDTESAQAIPASAPARKTFISLLILIPLFSFAGYALLGNPTALQPEARAPQSAMTPEKIAAMVDRLAQKQKEHPEDLEGWLRLAQAYKVMGRFAEAADAYSKAEVRVREDAGLLASYAEVLGMSRESGMKGKPTELLNAALKLDPNHPHVLLMAGVAAMQRGDNAGAISYWEKLLPQMEPGSELEGTLRNAIERLKSKAPTAGAKK